MPGGLRAAAGAEQAPQGDIGSVAYFRVRDVDIAFGISACQCLIIFRKPEWQTVTLD